MQQSPFCHDFCCCIAVVVVVAVIVAVVVAALLLLLLRAAVAIHAQVRRPEPRVLAVQRRGIHGRESGRCSNFCGPGPE